MIYKNIKFYINIFLFFVYSYDIIINLFFSLKIFILKKFHNNILIHVDLSGIKDFHGPGNFIKGINNILPFITNNCIFSSKEYINNILQPDYFYFPWPKFDERDFDFLLNKNLINQYILGPTFVPTYWPYFPLTNNWKEKRFSEILNITKGIVIHSKRVRDYLAQRSNTTNNLKKYIIMRACTNIKPRTIKSFKKRKIDIIFFEKYMDLNRQKNGEELYSLLSKTNKTIVTMKYGKYEKKYMKKLANNSKFIIYFSFYDTGAIGLKEIQNYGVLSFTLQEDLVIDNETSFYIPELANQDNMILASEKIIDIMNKISKKNPKSDLIAEKNQKINKCENALKDFCESLFQ